MHLHQQLLNLNNLNKMTNKSL